MILQAFESGKVSGSQLSTRGKLCSREKAAVLAAFSFFVELSPELWILWTLPDLNRWPPPCHGGALPAELRALKRIEKYHKNDRIARNYLTQSAPVAQWIEQTRPKGKIEVRFLSGAQRTS